ncbi:putative protein kinase [Leptomonas pyrrhocoris]|uniref:Protein kinase domain-containing protein n=1 Tax=Leptomonas pyrrhocoris TaxID=157538 RepID=A0A0M9FS05_LEPPY|nr:putative protein kinase [Leptomonas pyrrhocoris]KPA74833.1 putative protein kinase [Leptomonas pyrrhocoris]|eukprot:XP_015653272.1 putative protein kinase [Leptomonas pyrrhocoris]
MASVRLVIVLVLYALLVASALVTITVVFSVLTRNTMNGLVLRLARASMASLKQAAVDQISHYEITTYLLAMLLERLYLTPFTDITSQNVNDFIPAWKLMTMPEMNINSKYLGTFSLKLDTTTNLWYMTGCDRETQLCSLYDAAANTTQYVKYKRRQTVNPIDPSTVFSVNGPPPLYARYLESMDLYPQTDDPGWWSHVYIEYAQRFTTHLCHGVRVAKTTDFFYCTDVYTLNDGSNQQRCRQLVGVTVEVTEADTFDQGNYISQSTVFLTSTLVVDNVNDLCDPDPDIADAIDKFLKSCKSELLTDCTEYFSLGKPNVFTVIGYSQPNGLSFVIADRAPHSFFYKAINHSQQIAIAISVVMIVVVVILSVVISISIVVPISFICASMKNASNLTYEHHMAPITRYTIISEVKQLCASYLDLRQALKDLKSFMPQGLLVGASDPMDTTSLLSALMSGGPYNSGDEEESAYHEDYDDDETDDGNEAGQEAAGRAGGYSSPETTTSGETFTPQSEAPRRLSPQAVRPSFVALADEDSVPDSPPPTHHRRSTAPNSNCLMSKGIVSVVAVSTVDDALARDAALNAEAVAKDASRKQSYDVDRAGVPPLSPPPQQQQQQPQRRRSSQMREQNPPESPSPRHVKFRRGVSSLNAASFREEGASLRLNRSVYTSDVNRFRNVNCSLVCIRYSFKYIDEHSLEGEVNRLMNIFIHTILRYGGVIEVFRPDVIVVSFGAHAVMSLHTQRATAAAITITKKLTVSQRACTRLVVDTGSFYCGICGANGRVSPVIFGDRFDWAVELLRYDLGLGRLVVTDRVALCLPGDFVVPFDYVITQSDRAHGCQLFLVLNPAKRNNKEFRQSVEDFRRAYTFASSGKYKEALEIVARGGQFDPELVAGYVKTYKYLLNMNPPRPRYCRFQLPLFEPLGVIVKLKEPKYQHDRLHINELEDEDEEHVSINFGFGGGSSSGTAPNVDNEGDRSRSHAFAGDGGSSGDNASMHPNLISTLEVDANRSKTTGTQSGMVRTRSRAFSRDSTTAARSFAITDDTIGSGTDRTPGSESWSRVQRGDRRRCYTENLSRAGDTGRTDYSEEGLPLVFTDHKGVRWHRFPHMIGVGAFAEVYKTISENGSLMALKCIHLAATNVQLADVVSEVNTACKLFSDFIVNHIGWAHVGSYMIIIMDYMSGGSVHSAMSAFPSGLTLQIARRYASDSVRGLAYLHRNGVVHADLKPHNMLLAADGGCRLSDFGSSVTKANARSSGGDVFHLRGTPVYMSPEVARGDPPSMKSDMWSFGITLYELLTGRQPWMMKKNAGMPAVPGRSLLASAGNNRSGNSPAAASVAVASESATAAAVIENAALHAVHDVYGLKNAADGSASTAPKTPNANNSSHSSAVDSSVVAAPRTTSVPSLAAADTPEVEWVPVQGLSDARLVQGIANGTVQVRVEQKDLPTLEAYQLIDACLQESPQRRPISWEVVDHPFFFSY